MSTLVLAPVPVEAITPNATSPDAWRVQQQRWDAIEHFAEPVSQSWARITGPLDEIDEYRDLEEDWDLEGALRIDAGAADLASRIVQWVDATARQQGVLWREPVLGPIASGGILLTWGGPGRRVTLLTQPGMPYTVECVIEMAGARPNRQVVSVTDAIEHALWALSAE
jgi:hypothetical protein